jgi:ribosomal protein S18 acetylase RimI-like enzyme
MQRSGCRVTAARLQDCRRLAEIHIGSWQAAYASLFPADYLASLSVADRAASWVAILEAGASRTLVARRAGDALGFVSFGPCRDEGAAPDRGEIWALYVAPEAWSSRVGWALWEAARVQLLHRGCADVSLWVLSGNARGLRFYESVGFRREPRSEQYFERGGARIAEMKLVFAPMSAHPASERVLGDELSASGAAPSSSPASHRHALP